MSEPIRTEEMPEPEAATRDLQPELEPRPDAEASAPVVASGAEAAADAPVDRLDEPGLRRRVAEVRRLRRLRFIAPVMVLLALLSWTYTTHFIPSPSMEPTLLPGDHIIALRSWIAYPGGATPKRGDIVVFLPPEQPAQPEGYYSTIAEEPEAGAAVDGLMAIIARRRNVEVWIKRVVGLPGEVVQIARGSVFINGRELDHRYYSRQPDAGPDQPYMFGFFPVRLGADEVFVLGDNAMDSDDSRYWGPLKVANITSRFVSVLFREGANGPNARKARAERQEGG